MRTVCFKLPETLLKTIDEMVEKFGYTSRSDLIRDAIRALVREKARELMEQAVSGGRTSKKSSSVVERVKVVE
jgi:metal-responsive CopG/Arc/MetJ family transcriptional regulator